MLFRQQKVVFNNRQFWAVLSEEVLLRACGKIDPTEGALQDFPMQIKKALLWTVLGRSFFTHYVKDQPR